MMTRTEELDRVLRAVVAYMNDVADNQDTCEPLKAFRDAIEAASDALDTMSHYAADSNDFDLRDRLDLIALRFAGLRSELS